MKTTTSQDGTRIAFESIGHGPAVVLVMGAFNDRSTGMPLATHLAPHYTVFTYDRRGRGDSGDTVPHSTQREIEDLAAVIAAAGGTAAVLGYSSGASLALQAAAHGLAISKLALYETPPWLPRAHAAAVAALIADGRRGDAVEYFQRQVVGLPEPLVASLRVAPFRPALEAMAHTLVYDLTIMADGPLPPDDLANLRQPVLAIAGEKSPQMMREVAERLVTSLPDGRALILPGATHDISPPQLGPALESFWA